MQAGVPDVRTQSLSGPASHVIQVIRNFQELGHQVCLVANFGGQIWKSNDFEVFEPITVRWIDNVIFQRFESVVRRLQSELRLPYAALFESIRFAQACCQELSTEPSVAFTRQKYWVLSDSPATVKTTWGSPAWMGPETIFWVLSKVSTISISK